MKLHLQSPAATNPASKSSNTPCAKHVPKYPKVVRKCPRFVLKPPALAFHPLGRQNTEQTSGDACHVPKIQKATASRRNL